MEALYSIKGYDPAGRADKRTQDGKREEIRMI